MCKVPPTMHGRCKVYTLRKRAGRVYSCRPEDMALRKWRSPAAGRALLTVLSPTLQRRLDRRRPEPPAGHGGRLDHAQGHRHPGWVFAVLAVQPLHCCRPWHQERGGSCSMIRHDTKMLKSTGTALPASTVSLRRATLRSLMHSLMELLPNLPCSVLRAAADPPGQRRQQAAGALCVLASPKVGPPLISARCSL